LFTCCNLCYPLWQQKGDDIDGEADDFSGKSVSLSSDGTVLAIGASDNDGNGADSGHVRVYKWNAGTSDWDQMGDDIVGKAAGDKSGVSVSLSSDGTVLAIGAFKNDGANGADSGHVRVYKWNAGTSDWDQMGDDIDGEAAGDESGVSVSLSSDGNIVAIGANYNDGANGDDSGHVRVYGWNTVTASWDQMGDDIDGEAYEDYSGVSVSLSDNGTVLAIGADYNDGNALDDGYNSGHVRVYKWNAGTSDWDQMGDDIVGKAECDQSGWSVSLSSDGTVVAIGAPYNDDNVNNSGHVRVYEWNTVTTSWEQRGDDIVGEAPSDFSGYSVSLSSDGTVVAIGAFYNGGNGTYSGHVRVYEWNADTSSWEQKGIDIDGEDAYDRSGYSVSLSGDGTVVAIGAPYNDGSAGDDSFNSGHVRVYEFY